MGRFSRFRRAVARVISRVIPIPTRQDRDREDREPPSHGGGGFIDRGDRDFDYGGDRGGGDEGSRLSDGWKLVGLYHHGEGTTRIDATDDTEVTDSEIANADALVVWYEPAGDDGYKWIHGAGGWDSLSDLIDTTLMRVSPPK